MNTETVKSEKDGKNKSGTSRTMNGRTKLNPSNTSKITENLTESLSEMTTKAADEVSHQFKKVTDQFPAMVALARKYPLYTALGAASVGFVAGIAVGHFRGRQQARKENYKYKKLNSKKFDSEHQNEK